MNPCIPEVQLVAFARSELNPKENAHVDAHLVDCTRCQEALDRITRQVLKGSPFSSIPLNLSESPFEVTGYQLLRELGRGGMGVVWLAEQLSLKRLTALKTIRFQMGGNVEELSRRLKIEAEAIGRLAHPNIVQIFETGLAPHGPYFTMEYVEGGSLKAKLDGVPWAPASAARLIADLARAIHRAHQAGIVHRDLKPSNILMERVAANATQLIPKISDFGLAKLLDSEGDDTLSGRVLGTPNYMAPEQASGKGGTIGPTTDIYSLGVMLYELLTGRPPFHGATPIQTLECVAHSDPAPPRLLQPGLSRDLEAVCLKCLEKEPSRRYATAAALAEDLRRFVDGEPVLARSVGPIGRMVRWTQRRPVVAALGSLLIVTAVAGLVAIFDQIERRRSDAAEHRIDQARVEERAIAAESARQLHRQRIISYIGTVPSLQSIIGRSGTGRQTEDRLNSLMPTIGAEDLRGFEWYYWWAQSHAKRTLFTTPSANLRLAVRPDGQQLASTDGTSALLWNPHREQAPVAVPAEFGPIRGVAYSPDSLLLALGGADGSVRIMDAASQKLTQTLKAPAEDLEYVAFDPTGKYVAAVAAKGAVIWWDLRTGEPRVQTPTRPVFWPRCLQFTQDGSRLFAAYANATVSLDVTTGAQVDYGEQLTANGSAIDPTGQFLLTGEGSGFVSIRDLNSSKVKPFSRQTDAVHAVAYSPDGNLVATAGRDQIVRLWSSSGEPNGEFTGHTEWVQSLAFAPDANWLASADRNGRIAIWPIKTGSQAHTWQDRGAYGVAIHPDGRRGASAGSDGRVTLWELATGKSLRSWVAHAERALNVSFSPDGMLLASAGVGKRNSPSEPIKLWFVETGAALSVPYGGPSNARAVVFSPDGKRLAAGGSDGRIHLCEWASSLGPWRTCAGRHQTDAMALAFTPDGRRLASVGGDSAVRLWDVATATELPRPDLTSPHTRILYGVAFDDQGRVLASVGFDQKVKLWDTVANQHLATFSVPDSSVNAVAFNPSDKTFLTAGGDGVIRRWDPRDKKEAAQFDVLPQKRPFPPKSGYKSLAISSSGRQVFAATLSGTLRVWNAGRLPERNCLTGQKGPVEHLSFAPDSRTLASPGGDGTVRLWDIATEKELVSLDAHPGGAFATAVSPDGALLATTGKDGDIRLWLLPEGKPVTRLEGQGSGGYGLAFSPDGQRLAAGRNKVFLWDVARKEVLRTLAMESSSAVNQLAFHADGKRLAAAYVDKQTTNDPGGKVRIWDCDTGATLWSVRAEGKVAHAVAFGKDFVAAAFANQGGSDSQARIWDLATGKERLVLRSAGFHFYSLALAPDQKTLATGQWDGSVRLWHVQTGAELSVLRGHSGYVYSVTFAPDGKTLASAGADGAIRLWRAADQVEVEAFDQAVRTKLQMPNGPP